MIWNPENIIKATHGKLLFGDSNLIFNGISIDSRKVKPDCIYIAIIGDKNNGHSFINQVFGRGVKGIIVQEDELKKQPTTEWEKNGKLCISVKDTTKALGNLAGHIRNIGNAKVIAITGTNGKTTVKEMAATLISSRYNTLKTIGNFNNHIGLPLTLLNLKPAHEIAVLELGMNHFGEIRYLANISKPDIGIITNIGPGHLEGVYSLDGVLKAKAELIEGLDSQGTLILNGDDPYLRKLKEKAPCPVIFFGKKEDATIMAREISNKETCFKLILPGSEIEICLKIPGSFMISNALAVASIGYALNFSKEEIKNCIESASSVNGRMNIITSANQIHIIDDTYNANPSSMSSAIESLKSLRGKNRGIIVLGDMFELGESAYQMHKEIGTCASNSGSCQFYATGNFSDAYLEGVKNAQTKPDIIFTGSKKEIIEKLLCNIKTDDWVLIKGSRGMGMEQVVSELISSLDN